MSGALQARTADQAGNPVMQFVSFQVERQSFAVEVSAVREIMRIPQITRMPGAPGCVEGIISLRGSVIPIISLRERFGLFPAGNDSRTRIMVVCVGARLVGFKVDSVSEVVRASSSQIQPPPGLLGKGEGNCVVGVVEAGQGMLILLDAQRMLPASEWEVVLGEAA